MYRTLLFSLLSFIGFCSCAHKQQPEIIICVKDGKLNDKLLEKERYACDVSSRFPIQWGTYTIPNSEIFFLGDYSLLNGGLNSFFLYHKRGDKVFYFQELNIFKEPTVFLDSLYLFSKKSSASLDHFATISSEPFNLSFLEYWEGPRLYKLSSASYFLEVWQKFILPHIENLMIEKKTPETYITEALLIIDSELKFNIKTDTILYIGQGKKGITLCVINEISQTKKILLYQIEI